MDEDTATKDDFLGMVEIPLNDILIEETENSSKTTTTTTNRYTLKPSQDGKIVKGQIQMSLAYLPIQTPTGANTNKDTFQDKKIIKESEDDFDFSSSSSSEEEVPDGQDFDFSSSSSSEEGTLDY